MNRTAAAICVFLFLSAGASAQTTPAWGIASEIVYPIYSQDFAPVNSTMTYAYSNNGRFATSALGSFQVGLPLPSGSVITRIELDACDNSSTADVSASIVPSVKPFGGGVILGTVSSGVPFTDGGACGTFSHTLASPHTVDYVTNGAYYVSAANNNNLTSSTRIVAVRVFYRLQVSPAPVVASFADVPTSHPFFQFIEAMAASGITAGCGGGNYCPNDPLTRGQMAVFLSRALGLHWTP